MENRDIDNQRWVEDRFRALDPANEWQPNPAAALAGLRRRDRRRQTWRRSWAWSTATAAAAVVIALALPAPAKCALVGVGCPRPAVAVLLAPAGTAAPAKASYKESGSATAPVVCEIYTDYECPHCANFYNIVFPQLAAEYVKTGKVRIVHRDFPLPQHPFAKLAARYANAAGELGHYDEVVAQLFRSQAEWATNGNIDAAVAHVLSADTMQKVRALVQNDPRLDATLATDMSMVVKDQINQTPSLVFVYKGARHKVANLQSFDLLKAYLQELMAK